MSGYESTTLDPHDYLLERYAENENRWIFLDVLENTYALETSGRKIHLVFYSPHNATAYGDVIDIDEYFQEKFPGDFGVVSIDEKKFGSAIDRNKVLRRFFAKEFGAKSFANCVVVGGYQEPQYLLHDTKANSVVVCVLSSLFATFVREQIALSSDSHIKELYD